MPSCAAAGGDTCVADDSSACDGFDLIDSYDCALCCATSPSAPLPPEGSTTAGGTPPNSTPSCGAGCIAADGTPFVIRQANGALEVFARGADGAVYETHQSPGGAAPWSSWQSLSGFIYGAITGAANTDGRIEIFVHGGDHAMWHNWQTSPGGAFSGWSRLGGSLGGDPTAGVNRDGRIEVFARGGDGSLVHVYQRGPSGSGGWSGFGSLGGSIVGRPAVGRNTNGNLEVFARGGAGVT
jgi:hypothetical protein